MPAAARLGAGCIFLRLIHKLRVAPGSCPPTSRGRPAANLYISDGGIEVPLESLDLADLADNGGPTHTVAMGANSLSIGRGHDNVCAASPVNNEDQRGVTRPQGSHCDIGAFERHRRADLPTRRRVGSSTDH